MKIAIFSDNFFPELSGIADSIIALAKALSARGHEIHFFVPQYSVVDYRKGNLLQQELDLGPHVHIHRLSSFSVPSPTGQARLVLPIGGSLREMRKIKPDIIHTQLIFGVGLEALLAGKMTHTPVIGTNHTAITEFVRYLPVRFPWAKSLALRYAVWYYNSCEFVTAPSESVFSEMVPNGFVRPHQALSNPIDTDLFTEKVAKAKEKEETIKKLKLSPNTIVYAGRLAAEKNIDTIIRALPAVRAKVPDVVLALAGHGAGADELRMLAKNLNVVQHVRFLGTLEKPLLAKLYRAGRAFAIASTSETQSMTLMQALACGLPAVGVNARALPEYITPENGFIVEPGDAEGMANALIGILKNKKTWSRLSKGARRSVERYAIPRVADTWEELYRRYKKT
ncbi:glycosyltransferase [Patescibacteria group bacterium]|nr:glycosyltransferase [Patescibacteria group bacterium]